MVILARNLGREVEKVVRKAALRIDQVAVTTTPVDTGRARNNWILTISKPSSEANRTPDKSGAGAIAEAAGAVKGFKVGKGVLGSIHIANNVEYIVPLENGWSKKAPAGMMRAAVSAGVQYIRDNAVIKLD